MPVGFCTGDTRCYYKEGLGWQRGATLLRHGCGIEWIMFRG